MKIMYAAISEAGLRDGENQDSIFCSTHEGGGVFLVADGMGGHENGRAAGQTVKEEVRRAWERCTVKKAGSMHPYLQDENLKEALSKANKEIRTSAGERGISGSTAVLIRIGEGGFTVLNCGDSRCYRLERAFPSAKPKQLTTDDVQEKDGKLLRAVGTETGFSCALLRGEIRMRTLFVLCSDGVYKYLDEKVFSAFLRETLRSAKAEELLMRQIDRLRDMIYENGAPDNFSLILVTADPGK